MKSCLPLALLMSMLAPGVQAAPKPAHAPAPDAPPAASNDVKQIGDWSVRCFPVKSAAPCDMFELLTQKRTGEKVMSISLAYEPKANRHLLQIVVPLGVSLPKGATIVAGSYTSPRLLYRRCNKAGCFIEGTIEAPIVAALSVANAQAKMVVASDNGGPLNIPFSLRGFAQAHDAMAILERQKADIPVQGDKRSP